MKRPKICIKIKNLFNKMQSFGFLLLNYLDQIFKIFTIVETLVTLTGSSRLIAKEEEGTYK